MSAPPCTTYQWAEGRSLDVYLPEKRAEGSLPTLLYLPGGGLCDSRRKQCAQPYLVWSIEKTLARGFAFVSAEYPHMQTTDGYGIVESVDLLFEFIRNELSDVVDMHHLGIYASSAGCYIAMQTALRWPVPPRALGLGWQMGGHFLTNDEWWLKPWPSVKGFFERLDPDYLLVRLLKEGSYLDRFTGEAGFAQKMRVIEPEKREAALTAAQRPLFPELHIAGTAKWPPTFMAHGTKDTATSVEESRHLKEVLSKRGDVEVEMRLVPGADHGLEGGGELSQETREAMMAFVHARI